MKICADEYTRTVHGKSFQEAAEKATISFHFGGTFHYNSVYYGKIGSIESVTNRRVYSRKVCQVHQ